jgi:hypothetical protein
MDPEEGPEMYSIFLRGIDTTQLIKEHQEGKYSTISIPSEKINFTNNSGSQLFVPGNNPNLDKTFFIASTFHGGDTFATTNCERFKTFYLDGKEVIGGTCQYCGRNYKTAYFGWPKKIFSEKSKLIVQLDYDNCSFECLDAELDILQYHPLYRDEVLKVRENMLRLWNILCPGKELIPMPFYKLLTTKGGSIDPDNLNLTAFTPTDEIIAAPIKTVFAARKKTLKDSN